MARLTHVNDIENPENMRVKVFVGADNTFELYEDDGVTDAYRDGKYAVTKMELRWSEKQSFVIYKPEGDSSVTVEKRNFELEFVGVSENSKVKVIEGRAEKEFEAFVRDGVFTVNVTGVTDTLVVSFEEVELKENDVFGDIYKILQNAEIEFATKDLTYEKLSSCKSKTEMLREVLGANIGDDVKRALCEVITAED